MPKTRATNIFGGYDTSGYANAARLIADAGRYDPGAAFVNAALPGVYAGQERKQHVADLREARALRASERK